MVLVVALRTVWYLMAKQQGPKYYRSKSKIVPKCFFFWTLWLAAFNRICPQSGRYFSKSEPSFLTALRANVKSFIIEFKLLGNYKGVHFSCNSARTKARYDIWMCRWVCETHSHSAKVWKVNKRRRTYLECHLTGSQLTCQTFTVWNYWSSQQQQAQSWYRYVCALRISCVWGRAWADLLTTSVWSLHHWGDVTVQHRPQRMLEKRFLLFLSVRIAASFTCTWSQISVQGTVNNHATYQPKCCVYDAEAHKELF